MRLRKITKVGGSWFIKLEPADLKDLNLKEGDFVDIEDINKNEKEVQNETD